MTGNGDSATLHAILRVEKSVSVVFKRLPTVDISTPCLAVCNSIVFTLVNNRTRSAVADAKPGGMHTLEQIISALRVKHCTMPGKPVSMN